MSAKHYEERYYVRDEIQGEYDEHRRSSSRRRSGSRHRAPPPCPEDPYYRQRFSNLFILPYLICVINLGFKTG